jgi:hypothetical protein
MGNFQVYPETDSARHSHTSEVHMPFFLLLIPMAAYGVQQMIDFVGNKKQKIRG